MSDFKAPDWAGIPSQPASIFKADGSDVQDISQQPFYLFGRDTALGCNFLVDDPSVSRRHAALVHHIDGRIYIIDLASRTGTQIDGARIPPNKPTKVSNGSRITIGPDTFVLKCTDAAPAQAPTAKVASDNPSQVCASHILVKHKDVRRPASWKEPVVTRTKEEALAMIEAFQQQILSGQTEFAQLASMESHCSSARNGGDLGWFGRGQMQRPFEEGAFGLEVGQMSGPVFSDSGVHLILRTG